VSPLDILVFAFGGCSLSGACSSCCFGLPTIAISESRLTPTQTPTGTAMHGDQMEETLRPPTRKKSGWSMGPRDRIEDEVWHRYDEPAIDQRSPECNKHGSHQALSLAVLSIAAQWAQSHHLAFKVSYVHAFCGQHFASRHLEMSSRNWPAYVHRFLWVVYTGLQQRHKQTFISYCRAAHTQRTALQSISLAKNKSHCISLAT
jgi:hypothetical protein